MQQGGYTALVADPSSCRCSVNPFVVVPGSTRDLSTAVVPDAGKDSMRQDAAVQYLDPIWDLAEGNRHAFCDWPVSAVPDVAAGVYAIWDNDQLIYVGMSGRGATRSLLEVKRFDGKRFGLFTRLASHASGRRSGDQFCVYVADQLVLPRLSADQIDAISRRELRFDNLVKEYIHSNLDFGFVETWDGEIARDAEDDARSGALGQKPLLNPTKRTVSTQV